MPTSEPVPGSPTSVWAGPGDAVAFFDSIGMGKLAAPAALLDWRVVDIPTLCASPPPVADEFTMLDILQGLIPGQAGTVRDKLHNWVDRGLWANHCQYTDSTPQPTVTPQPDVDGYPPGQPAPSPDEKELRQIYLWIRWIARNMLPRAMQTGDPIPAQGNGFFNIPGIEMDDWPVQCMGVSVSVQLKPDYAGRSNGGDFPVFYDLGWFSLSTDGSAESPVRLQHTSQINMASLPRVNGLYHNLPPGVEVEFTPIYPDSPGMGGGG